MIASGAIGPSDAARRAERIYAEARSQIDVRLWRAALGSNPEASHAVARPGATPAIGMANLLGLITADRAAAAAPAPAPPVAMRAATQPKVPAEVPVANASPPVAARPAAGLGANAGFSATIADAAARAGIPAAALASIIDAEAAKNKAGVWQTGSRNTRSTATGLGQFLSGTWTSEAQRAGTWLNGVARRNGWLGSNGNVRPEMQAALLALRHDAGASINATADYARRSLDALSAAGAAIGTSVDEIAHAAYLGHNLGVGDAVRFLKGSLGDGHARRLLDAQIGSGAASQRVAAAGSASAAHRGWLLGFLANNVNASQFL